MHYTLTEVSALEDAKAVTRKRRAGATRACSGCCVELGADVEAGRSVGGPGASSDCVGLNARDWRGGLEARGELKAEARAGELEAGGGRRQVALGPTVIRSVRRSRGDDSMDSRARARAKDGIGRLVDHTGSLVQAQTSWGKNTVY